MCKVLQPNGKEKKTLENNLVKDAAEARKAGMSYGKWMAMKDPVKIVKKKKEEVPVCLHCGRVLKGQQRKWCSSECASEEGKKKRRQLQKEEVEC
jgi:hypothetical protein